MTNNNTDNDNDNDKDPEASFSFPPGEKETTPYCVEGERYYSIYSDEKQIEKQVKEFWNWIDEGILHNAIVHKGLGSEECVELWASPELIPNLLKMMEEGVNKMEDEVMNKWK